MSTTSRKPARGAVKKPLESFETVNPTGRLDVAAYRASKALIQDLESRHGLEGLWGSVSGLVESGIRGLGLPQLEVSEDVQRLMGSLFRKQLQANNNPGSNGNGSK